jgi:hypothetical protein
MLAQNPYHTRFHLAFPQYQKTLASYFWSREGGVVRAHGQGPRHLLKD